MKKPFRRAFASLLALALAVMPLCALADGWEGWYDVTEVEATMAKLLYRIPVEGAPNAPIPANFASEEGAKDAIQIVPNGVLYDYNASEARVWSGEPMPYDAAALLDFFGMDATEADVDGTTESYSSGDSVLTIQTELGTMRYERDGGAWYGALRFSSSALDPNEYRALTASEAKYAGPAQALADAQALLAIVDAQVEAMPVDGYGLFEHEGNQTRETEIYAFALAYDGIPASNHATNTDTEMIPAQELRLIYDEAGLAEVYLSAYRLAPAEDAQPLRIDVALENLRKGEGAFLFSQSVEVSMILLQYSPVAAEDGTVRFVPSWSFCEFCDSLPNSWFSLSDFANYDAHTGAAL